MTNSSTVVFRALQRAMLSNLAVLCLVGGTALWGLWVQGGALEALALRALPRAVAISNMREGISRFQVSLLRFMGYLDKDLGGAHKGLDQLRKGLDELGLKDDAEVKTLVADYQRLHVEMERLEKMNQSLEVFEELDVQFKGISVAAQAVDQRIEALFARLYDSQTLESRQALEGARKARILVSAGLALGLLGGVATVLFVLQRLQNPFRELLGFLSAAADKDLAGTLRTTAKDELGALAGAASRLSGTLVGTLRSLVTVARNLSERGTELQNTALKARTGAEDQVARAGTGAEKARGVESSLEPLTALAGKLKEEAEQAASSIQEILAMTEQVQSEMEGLCTRVEAASDSVQDLDEATSRVAAVTAQLGAAAQAVAASAASIDVATETLRTGAREGRALADDVATRAASGRSSMSDALVGMARIREAVDTAVQRFDRLGVELGRVDRVTQVIDDIAGRTNLLSLNAAIIAAQAGEQGRAFGVVASEIRNLAEKTAASTREIRAIVDGVASGGREAAEAIAEGVTRVEKGEEMVRKTGNLLEAIHTSAEHAAQRLREIDAVAESQATDAACVADEIRQVSQGVVDIVSEIRAEEERTGEIRKALTQMAEVARHTVRASDEQSEGTQFITRTVTAVSHAAEQVDEAIEKVGALLRSLRADLEVLDARAREELELVARLEDEGVGLTSLAADLQQEVGTFRLPREA